MGANLGMTYFVNCDLGKANFKGAFLENAQFSNQTKNQRAIRNTCFVNADLTGANFDHLILSGVDLAHSEIWQTSFKGTDLRKVLHLDTLDLSISRGDNNTKLPDSINRPLGWGIKPT